MSALDGLRFDPSPECPGCGGLNDPAACTNAPDCEWNPRRYPIGRFARTHTVYEDLHCHESVTRRDEDEPCNRAAVGYRLDPNVGDPYPVCRKHHRPPYWLTARNEATR